jgi:hypothetical protein
MVCKHKYPCRRNTLGVVKRGELSPVGYQACACVGPEDSGYCLHNKKSQIILCGGLFPKEFSVFLEDAKFC